VNSPGRRALLLWDVDHTLIDSGGVSKDNYRLAFRVLTGFPPAEQPRTEGRTDVAIMERLLSDNGIPQRRYSKVDHLATLERAGASNADALGRRGHALPGAHDVLRSLSAQPCVIQSVLTGNIEANARVKLAAFGLDGWTDFSVGGFGETFADRGKLVAVAQDKASDRYGFDPVGDTTIVIGDAVCWTQDLGPGSRLPDIAGVGKPPPRSARSFVRRSGRGRPCPFGVSAGPARGSRAFRRHDD
jgi:phosphoglycolate phosphatase